MVEVISYERRLTLGEKKEMKTSSKAKVYIRGFHFTDLDAIRCMIGLE